MSAAHWLRHPLLDAFEHGFGTRGCEAPVDLVRVRQVHGRAVHRATVAGAGMLGEGDALVCAVAGVRVGIVTADCLPVLIATPSGAVAAVHAGWRGLAQGVLASAVAALGALTDVERAVAVIGPHIGASCYEVDAPVVSALEARFGADVADALRPTRPGHFEVGLARLAALDLARSGIADTRIASFEDACTACSRERFHSYRRDGPGSGRLVHYITAR